MLQTGGTCELPDGLPPLLCHEIAFKQNQKGGRGGFWLLFGTAKTPFGKDQFYRLTESHVTIEINYGTKYATMQFDFGPNWQKAMNSMETFEYFRHTWECGAGTMANWLFLTVQRFSDQEPQDVNSEAA